MTIQATWKENALLLWDLRRCEAEEVAALRDMVGQISSDALLASAAQDAAARVWLPEGGALVIRELPALQFSPAEAIDPEDLTNPRLTEAIEAARETLCHALDLAELV